MGREPWDKVKDQVQHRGVSENSPVKVALRDKTEVRGYISQIDAESFQVTDKKSGRARTVAYADVDRVGGSGMSKAAKIALGMGIGGILAGVAVAKLPKD